ncbi:hypothetical protein ASF66_20860 [Pseudomonas sp. Leaf129]|uniref:hypothetical protein n=1 Tax=Pseudomonas sp. Leaf129 TaxID=1736268 RepID=UPI000702E026|nr:hypothetical protein [Pseudomonas sp. Leaf129]KQQ56726.1 hypothetical protein ASF66_20860 [Pseudomonas sp. Leaf129]
MRIDATQFPFVWLQKNTLGDTQEKSLAEFEDLLARDEAFVLLSHEGLGKEQPAHTPDEKKQMALWMKRHKTLLKKYVKASIQIESNFTKRIAGKTFAIVYEKFWGYPMIMTATENEALTLAKKLLDPEP